jgi:DnaJ-domain-containing protein 1
MKWVIAAVLLWAAWHYLRPKRKPAMRADEAEARGVLGVSPRADVDAIRAAHRRLLAEAHPDRGGSADVARRINAARDLLIARLRA